MKQTINIFLILLVCIGGLMSCGTEKNQESGLHFPSDKKATGAVTELLSVINTQLGNGIMLGHQDDLAYGNKWYGDPGRSDVKSVCGDYPAVFGWNITNIESGSTLNIDSVSFENLKLYIKEVHKMGGISALSWEAMNPIATDSSELSSKGNVVQSVLEDENIQKRYLSHLDQLATYLNSIKDEKGTLIPFIFQPFQEYNVSGKHWWSNDKCSPDEFKKLWKLTVDYLRNEKKVHHLLYACSFYAGLNTADITTCYPGKDYVDILGISMHLIQEEDPSGKKFMEMLNVTLDAITKFAQNNRKIVALTNTGLEGIKISNFFSEIIYPVISRYDLSYVMFGKNAWNDEKHYYIPVPGHPASDDFYVFSTNPKILTCSRINL